MSTSTVVPSKAEYFRLAEQFERLACSAKSESERSGLEARAQLFRRLGNARLETDEKEHHFPRRGRGY